MSGAQEQKFLLERDLVEVLELLVSMMGNVTVTQRNLVDAVSELQHAMLEHEHPQPEMEASGAADAQNTRRVYEARPSSRSCTRVGSSSRPRSCARAPSGSTSRLRS